MIRTRRAPGPWARFDDFPAGQAFELRDLVGTLVAVEPSEVVNSIERAEQAARRGCWVAGYVTYEAAAGLDTGLSVRAQPVGRRMETVPLVWFAVFAERVAVPVIDLPARVPRGHWGLEWEPDEHADAIERIKTLIAAGETYQVNLTARASSTVEDPLALYASMATAQQGAYHAYIDTGAHAVLCASPELFFEVSEGRVRTRPMKGTARRGRWPVEDAEAAARLLASAKDRAEHVMIVDLLRNDVGRIARPGGVRVDALMELERYPTVWQLTSTISGDLVGDASLVDVFTALFPPGSVTGAPKHRTMQAIAGLERSPRGVYCGAVGVLEPTAGAPKARFAVAIRTATVDLGNGHAEYGTGGGITWSSEAPAEWDELVAKTTVLHGRPTPEGLFETMRYEPDCGVASLDRHLSRLAGSAAYFGIDYDDDAARAALHSTVAGLQSAKRVRLTLDRGGCLAVTVAAAPPPSSGPVHLTVANRPIRSDDVWLFHKTVHRDCYDHYRAEAGAAHGVDDVVLWNELGHVTETTIANVVVRLDGVWWTPPIHCGLLPGVERGRLLERGDIRERIITVDELRRAPALAVINSLRGWREAAID